MHAGYHDNFIWKSLFKFKIECTILIDLKLINFVVIQIFLLQTFNYLSF